jgi:hypothetical protein
MLKLTARILFFLGVAEVLIQATHIINEYPIKKIISIFAKWQVYTRSKRDAFFLSAFDFLGVGFLFMGIMFKNQHWPWANNMIMIGLVALAIGTVAWNQKFKKEVVQRKEAEDKLKETLTEIETQKQRVEEKQKEIIDSIQYAKRIQQSLLPTEKYIERTILRLRNKSKG